MPFALAVLALFAYAAPALASSNYDDSWSKHSNDWDKDWDKKWYGEYGWTDEKGKYHDYDEWYGEYGYTDMYGEYHDYDKKDYHHSKKDDCDRYY